MQDSYISIKHYVFINNGVNRYHKLNEGIKKRSEVNKVILKEKHLLNTDVKKMLINSSKTYRTIQCINEK